LNKGIGGNMKIFVMSSLNPWDDIRIFRKECRSLAKKYDVELHIPGDFQYKKIDGVDIFGIKKMKTMSRIFRPLIWIKLLYRTFKSDADVFHFHNPELIGLGILLKYIKRKAVVYDIHEDFPRAILSKHWIAPGMRKTISNIFDKIEKWAVNSVFTKSIVTTSLISERFNSDKIEKIENYAPLMDITNDKESNNKARDSKTEMIFTGSISKIRGVEEIIRAVSKLENEVELVFLGIFADAEYKKYIKNLLIENRINNVTLLDSVPYDDMIERMKRSDIGVIPYLPVANHLVTLPNKLFEYMACSLPVIASDFPLYKQVITDANCGVLCDPTDPDDIKNQISSMIENKEKMKKMGSNGNRMYKIKYNWDLEEKKLFNMYDNILIKDINKV